ncbi:hypothetical protein ONA00_00090 [Mycoplasmopsis cynos]|nr:hypothetical protein [Mycoplasmopsis cynos]WAM11532.1 hypothetical protein ONA00_00090 [Mycoplasmopsis cynos]
MSSMTIKERKNPKLLRQNSRKERILKEAEEPHKNSINY